MRVGKQKSTKTKHLIMVTDCGILNRKEVIYMSIDKAIENAVASVEMEGFSIDEQSKDLCRKLLNQEISMEQYISLIKQSVGVA